MKFNKNLLSKSILSVVDQAMLSALNFAIGLMLMRWISKEEYGLWGQLYSSAILVGLVVDSWIAGPLTAVATRVHEDTRKLLLKIYWGKQIVWTLVLAVLAFAVINIFPQTTSDIEIGWQMSGAFAVYLIGNGIREYGRTVGFIESDILTVFRQDLIYVGTTICGLILIYWLKGFELVWIFLLLGVASLSCAITSSNHMLYQSLRRKKVEPLEHPEELANALDTHQKTIRGHAKWAVGGVIVGWLTNYSYIYLSGIWLGLAAIADLNATRLLLMPIPLAVGAWGRVARTWVARMMDKKDWVTLKRFTITSLLAVEFMVACYVGALLLALPWLEKHIIGEKYAELDNLVVLWGLYFAVNSGRTLGTSWAMSGGAFRSMFLLGSITLTLVLIFTSIAIPRWGTAGAMYALIVVEIWELFVIWKFILPRMQRETLSSSNETVPQQDQTR